ncbi:hypothetical protein D3C77_813810 [compost metagenome]
MALIVGGGGLVAQQLWQIADNRLGLPAMLLRGNAHFTRAAGCGQPIVAVHIHAGQAGRRYFMGT